jgi:hypothetical protein
MPHWGRPQPPAGVGWQTGNSREPAVWAAGTLKSFSSFGLSQVGQRGRSSLRMRSSNWESQEGQEYS